MLDPHSFVNTTNACNFFIVPRGEYGIPAFEKNYSLYEAYGAEEVFLTGTVGAQTPVAKIDGKPIGTGERPMTQRIRNLYKALVEQNTRSS